MSVTPISTAALDSTTVYSSVRSPIRPSRRRSPNSTTAKASAEITRGRTTISTSRKKIRPTGSATCRANQSSRSSTPLAS